MPRPPSAVLEKAFAIIVAAGLLASASISQKDAEARSVTAQQPTTTQNPTTTGNAALGKQLYLNYSCWACHGYNAQTGNGARLLPPRLNERQFTLYIRAPRTLQMPAYSVKVLSDADVANIYAYILLLPREPVSKVVPLLDQLPR
jgi:mono/diheme cytochrome c family protein